MNFTNLFYLTAVVSEVNEEDDVCLEEPIDQIPWPVLQYQSSLASVNSAPPLPDKKKKTGGTSSEQGSPMSSPGDIKKKISNVNSESSSKESSPPTSLERAPLKPFEADQPSETPKEEEEAVKNKTSPKSGLSRKSSILKIRAFFEKSHSEPRSEKKSKNCASTRKASSFRLREGPKFYRTLEDDHTRTADDSEKVAKESNDFFPSQKMTVAQSAASVDMDELSQSFDKETAARFLSPSNAGKTTEDKPSLPVKRSKSMKVYRGFDIHTESSKTVVSIKHVEPTPVREAMVPTACGVVLSKTPSVTYISSKDKLYTPVVESATEHEKKTIPQDDRCLSSNKTSLPLTTSSLDRGREQRFTKPSTSLSGTPTCGSLDRGVVSHVENKITPTYVNVLIRNQVSSCHFNVILAFLSVDFVLQEAANTSKLDDDTRQLLHDCQAYLMHGDGGELLPREEKHSQRSTPHEKKHKDRPLKERRHSFKNAVAEFDSSTITLS